MGVGGEEMDEVRVQPLFEGGKGVRGERVRGERVSGTCEKIEFGPLISRVTY